MSTYFVNKYCVILKLEKNKNYNFYYVIYIFCMEVALNRKHVLRGTLMLVVILSYSNP
jgi:hypothetical protein